MIIPYPQTGTPPDQPAPSPDRRTQSALPAWCPLGVFLLLTTVWISQAASAENAFTLGAAEQQWLLAHPSVLRRGADPSWPPFEFVDSKGAYAGMCQDYTDLVAERLHLTFDIIPGLGWKEALDRVRSRDLDVITCLLETPERDHFMAFSKPFTNIPSVIFTRSDYPYLNGLNGLLGKKVAMVRDYAVSEYLIREYPKFIPVMFDTPLEALQAVALGNADAFVETLAVGIYFIQKQGLANLKVAAPAKVPAVEIRFGIRKDWQPLAAIIDRVLDTITPQEHTAILQRWVSVEYDPVIAYTLLWKVGGTLTVLLVLAGLWIRQVHKQKLALQASEARLISQRNALKQLTDDLEAYSRRIANELNMARETQTVLLPDTSTLRAVSDLHGLHVDSRFKPSSELGGDFWGLKSIDEDRVAIMMVDFSGHGINAALNTFRLHALLESEKYLEHNPAAYLQSINARLSPLLPAGQYATMFYGVIDLARDLLTYAGAATPSPLVFPPDHDKPLIGSGEGFPLGMFDDSSYENRELPFPLGASLLLYSDAITEGKTRLGERLGEVGLIDLAVKCLRTSQRETLVVALTEILDEILNLPLADDLTIVCATRSVGVTLPLPGMLGIN
jgi:serine phosphatase RsbU (regulator of sigma subunit)/ABC-type amino acid transport substrate-binding protein